MTPEPFPGLRIRPLAGSDEAELKRVRLEPEVSKWWGPVEPEFPRDEPESTRITIDPAIDNVVAIRSYEKVGFIPVGVMRAYERDIGGRGWHDALLMELVTGLDR